MRLAMLIKAKSELLPAMSHDLGTPLNAMIGFSELLRNEMPGKLNEKQKKYVEYILASSKRMLDIVNDILDLGKAETGKIELMIEKISVPEILDETISLLREKTTQHNVVIKNEHDSELNFIEADRKRLKQILFNLLSNAVKYSKPEGGTVTIITKKRGDMAKFSVSDTGIGIKEEDMGKLFSAFEQLNLGIASKYGSTGLGLVVTKKLVELQGGRITGESKYGQGSTFTFTLPIHTKKGD
jgi:signal transduction histidine kinase